VDQQAVDVLFLENTTNESVDVNSSSSENTNVVDIDVFGNKWSIHLMEFQGRPIALYGFVDTLSLEVAINCALTLKEHGLDIVNFVCGDRHTCETLQEIGFNTFYPEQLAAIAKETFASTKQRTGLSLPLHSFPHCINK